MKRYIAFLIVLVVLAITPRSGAEQRTEFGKQWVRSHPFSLLGWTQTLEGTQFDTFAADFTGAGLNINVTLSPTFASVGASAGIPWHARFAGDVLNNLTGPELNQAAYDMISAFNNVQRDLAQSDIAWLVRDEPPTTVQMWQTRWMGDYLKVAYPQSLVYANSYPITDAGTSYLNDFVNIIQPDVLMYDYYPARHAGGGTTLINDHLENLMIVRNKAMSVGIPYWSWVQSFDNTSTWRMPGESELRMQLFSLLTAGYTGLGYFAYTMGGWPTLMIEDGGGPNALYYAAADANAEVMNLGRALRFLTSTSVRFVSGAHGLPTGELSLWTPGAGGDSHITDVSVDSGQTVRYRDGLIGFFTDDDGQQYFMLTNLAHDPGTSAADETVDFTITFDGSVTEVLRLNRETGEEEVLTLDGSHALHLTLPGGTGDLFKYNNGAFVPEPSALAVLGISGLLGVLRRRAKHKS